MSYTEIRNTMDRIEEELKAVANREGFAPLWLTGNIRVDVEAQLSWYEVLDPDSSTLSYVTPDAPHRAAPGETLCGAASLEEAQDFGRQR